MKRRSPSQHDPLADPARASRAMPESARAWSMDRALKLPTTRSPPGTARSVTAGLYGPFGHLG
jgi:hypothetical protein